MDLAARPIRRLRGHGRTTHEEFWALNHLNMEVQPGQIVGIIGRNGAGKSTLLKILSQVTRPTTGRVELRGRVGSLLEVGTGFHPELTGRENIYLNGSILGMSRREIALRFDDIVAFSGIGQFLDTPVKRYSSGMYVRLAFAVAAHLDTEILIVDEVLAVGDIDFQRKCMQRMEAIQRQGRTILLVSHNMGSVTRLCTSALLLSHGTVAHAGSVYDCVARYCDSVNCRQRVFTSNGITLKLVLLDGQGQPAQLWRPGEDLIADVLVSGSSVRRQAVDLAFYSEDGVRIFSLPSDRMTVQPRGMDAAQSTFRFRVRNPGISCSSLSLDIGVRLDGSRDYAAWWQRVAVIALSHAELPSYAAPGALLCPWAECETGETASC
jgi:ABC-type polysaccharide/polyol phosphate transport system ATPase subunit